MHSREAAVASSRAFLGILIKVATSEMRHRDLNHHLLPCVTEGSR